MPEIFEFDYKNWARLFQVSSMKSAKYEFFKKCIEDIFGVEETKLLQKFIDSLTSFDFKSEELIKVFTDEKYNNNDNIKLMYDSHRYTNFIFTPGEETFDIESSTLIFLPLDRKFTMLWNRAKALDLLLSDKVLMILYILANSPGEISMYITALKVLSTISEKDFDIPVNAINVEKFMSFTDGRVPETGFFNVVWENQKHDYDGRNINAVDLIGLYLEQHGGIL